MLFLSRTLPAPFIGYTTILGQSSYGFHEHEHQNILSSFVHMYDLRRMANSAVRGVRGRAESSLH